MIIKRYISLLLAVLMSFAALALVPVAAENDKWIFIDGENITRDVNSAIVYRDIAATGQSQWGHDVVADASGTVTKIIEGGLSEGENLAVPQGGMIISSAGAKVQWFKDNVSVGSKVFYDGYTQRLFVCDADGNFDPYFEIKIAVDGEGEYIISNPTVNGTPYYTYDVAVDANGRVVSRGSNVTVPEGGFKISAAAKGDMQMLITYAPIGALCTVAEGTATLRFNKTMLKTAAEILLMNAETVIYNSKLNFEDADHNALDTAVAEISAAAADVSDYKTLTEIASRIEKELIAVCRDTQSFELRGAFHTPKELDIAQVRETVLSAKASGLNTLILNVTNGYGTIVALPEGNKFSQDSYFGGFDVLKAYIDVCEEENIALAISVDVYYNEYASIAAPEWLSETNSGATGASDKFYSPANSEFTEYFCDYMKFIVSEYEIENIMLNNLRYPKFSEDCDYGYDTAALQAFAEHAGISISEAATIKTELFDSPHWQNWVAYRMGQVTHMAESVSAAVKEIRSNVTLTAISARDTVDYFYMQDAIGWLESGIIDGICLGLFENDPDENDPLDDLAYMDDIVTSKGEILGAYTGKTSHFFVGLDAGQNTNLLSDAIAESRGIGADGVIFSDLSLYTSQNHYSLMHKGILKGDAVSPMQNTVYGMRQLLEYSKNKLNDIILPFGGCDEENVSDALTKINEALLALEQGVLSHEYAYKLESDIAMIFSATAAKQSVLKEFEAVTKLALLHKAAEEVIPPVIDEPIENPSEESGTGDESQEENGNESRPSNGNGDDDYAPDYVTTDEGSGISFGNILIYLFVGVTFASASAAVIVGIHRKSKRPAGSHMPKAMAREMKEKDKEE